METKYEARNNVLADDSIAALEKEYLNSPCLTEITYNLHTLGILINLAKRQRTKDNDGYCCDNADCDLADALEYLGHIENDIEEVYDLIRRALEYNEQHTPQKQTA